MNRRNFKDATVVVSGAGGGLGQAIALRFATSGSRLVLLDQSADGVSVTQAQIEASGGQCLGLTGDVTDATSCADAVRAATGRFGGIDVLVNNAGITHRSAFAATDPAVLRRVMEVNFFGAVNLTHSALPHLLQRRGAIIAISSVAGFSPLIARTGYAASKHAMHGFFESLRTEVQPLGVDVTMVCPSFIATRIDRNALGADGKPASHAQVVVGQRLTPGQVAERIHSAAERRSRLLLIGRTAWQAWWVSRLAPSLYERLMARRLRGELLPHE
jgi:NAD(P)-dependent dehydrogenase (short-subunit alcohol dehydrogenase family)